MKCTNTHTLISPCKPIKQLTFEESVELLPEDTRKPLQVLMKLYDIIEIEYLSIDEDYDSAGYIWSTITPPEFENRIMREQRYNLKLLVEHKVTKQRFVKLFKIKL